MELNAHRSSPQQQRLKLFDAVGMQLFVCEGEWDMLLSVSQSDFLARFTSWLQSIEIFRTQIKFGSQREVVQRVLPLVNPSVDFYPENLNELSLAAAKSKILNDVAVSSSAYCVALFIYPLENGLHRVCCVLPSTHADAVSFRLLANQITRIARGEEQRQNSDVLQYADLSEWMNQLLSDEAGESAAYYWHHKKCPLFAEQPLLGGKVLFSNPSFCVDVSSSFEINLDADEALILSAWALCIAKLTNLPKFPLGRLSAGRSMEELREAFGNLSRVLPLHISCDWLSSFETFRSHIVQCVDEVEGFQECFAWSSLAGVNDIDATPFCFYAFEYFDFTLPENDCANFIDLRFYSEPSLIKCSVLKKSEKTVLRFFYHPEYFQGHTIQLLGERMVNVIEEIITKPRISLNKINFILPCEEQLQLSNFQKNHREFERTLAFHRLFEEQASLVPDQIALEYRSETITYKELNARANHLANFLKENQIGEGDFVAIAINRSIDMVIGLLATLKTGAAYIPIDTTYPKSRIEYIVQNAQPKFALVNADIITHFGQTKALSTDKFQLLSASYSEQNLNASDNLFDPAYMIYTSGSTGKPKGVVVSNYSLFNYLQWAAREYKLNLGNGSLVHSSISFDLTITSLLAPLSVGQKAILIPEEDGVEGLVSKLFGGANYSLLKLTPSHLELLNRALPSEDKRNAVNVIVVGGEALNYEHVRPWLSHDSNLVIVNEYGPTEATVGCCVKFVSANNAQMSGAVSIGKPIDNTRLYVLDQGHNLLPIGSVGELYIGGAGLALGYHNRADLNATAFIQKTFSDGRTERLYRTGDLVGLDLNGNFNYLGRNDEQVKLRGYRIELGEIKNVLEQYDEIDSAYVQLMNIGTNADKHEVLVAYYVKNAASVLFVLDEFVDGLKSTLPHYMIPTHWVELNALPLNANGKVDKDQLVKPEIKGRYVPPGNPLERVLCEVWANVLQVAQVGIQDNYFTLGGDSIRSIGLIAAARDKGINFTLDQLFSFPTIEALANYLDGQKPGGQIENSKTTAFSLIEPFVRDGFSAHIVDAYPLTTLQQGMIYHNQFDANSNLYHDVFSYRLQIPQSIQFDSDLIRKAYDALLQKHAVLRTTFALSTYKTPLQLVHEHADTASLVIEDLSSLSHLNQQQAIADFLKKEKQSGFDISKLPLVRCYIHLLGADNIQFSISFHHAIIDGWSDALLVKELFENTIKLINGDVIDVRPLATEFSDYVRLEMEALADKEFEAFWMNKLENFVYSDIPVVADEHTGSDKGIHSVQFDIEQSVSNAIKDISAQAAVPLKSILLAIHMRALGLICAQVDVTTCLVSSCRPENRDGEIALGLFINSTPFRLRFENIKGNTWKDLIEATYQEESECLRYRRFPYGKLKNLTQVDAISETLFYFTDYHNLEGLFDSTGIKLLESTPHELTSFPFVAHFNVHPDTKLINGDIECDASRFGRKQALAYRDLYVTLVGDCVSSFNKEFNSIQLSENKPVYYSDLIAWQRKALNNLHGEKELNYWRSRLANFPKSINFPQVARRSKVEFQQTKSIVRELDQSTLVSFDNICQQYDVNRFSLFFTLYSVLLSRYSNEREFIIGTPLKLPVESERAIVDDLIYYTLALRVQINGNPLLCDFLQENSKNINEDFEHRCFALETYFQNNPKEQVDESLECLVYMSYSDQKISEHATTQLTCLPGQQTQKLNKATLLLDIQFSGNRVYLEWRYSKPAEKIIHAMADSFDVLLRGISDGMQQGIYNLDILSFEERKLLIDSALPQGVEYVGDRFVHVLFEEFATRYPGHIALVYDDVALSYEDLNQQANQLANLLTTEKNIRPGDMVGVFLESSMDLMIALIAILKAGGTYVPLDPNYPSNRLAYMVSDASLVAILTKQRHLSKLPIDIDLSICLDDEFIKAKLAKSSINNISAKTLGLTPNHAAYVIYTSGSTGNPKGVVVEHGPFCGHIAAMAQYYRLEAGDRILQFASISVDAAQEQIFSVLSVGASLCVRSQIVMQGKEFDQYCADRKITILDLPPAYISVLFEQKTDSYSYICDNVRLFILGGETLTLQIYERLKRAGLTCEVVNAYGPTETVITSTAYSFMLSSEIEIAAQSIPIGRPMAGREVYVLNSELSLVPISVPGELYIGGACLARGYLNNDEMTDERFIGNPFSSDANNRMYKTGDIVRWIDGKNLEFISRVDDQVKIRGFRVELGEIESILSNHPLVKEAVVVLKKGDGESKLAAYVVQECAIGGAPMEVSAFVAMLRGFLTGLVPDFMVPSYIVSLEKLPLTPAGKVNRRGMPEIQQLSQEHIYIAPNSPTEKILCETLEGLLRVKQLGSNTHFFHAGGDSLISLQLVSRLREKGVEIQVKDIFDAPIISQLAKKIEQSHSKSKIISAQTNEISRDNECISFPLTQAQVWFFRQNYTDSMRWKMDAVFELDQRGSVEYFAKSVELLVNSHEALRTTFHYVEGEWSATVSSISSKSHFKCIDLTHLNDVNEINEKFSLMMNQEKSLLEVNNGKLFQVLYFKLDNPYQDRISVLLHHVIGDIYSLQIICEDLLQAYGMVSNEISQPRLYTTTPIPEIVRWCNDAPLSHTIRRSVYEWMRYGPANEVGDFPTDFPLTSENNNSLSSAIVRRVLGEEPTRALMVLPGKIFLTGLQIEDIFLLALANAITQLTQTDYMEVTVIDENRGNFSKLGGLDLSRTVGWLSGARVLVLPKASDEDIQCALDNFSTYLKGVPYGGSLFNDTDDLALKDKGKIPVRDQIKFNYQGVIQTHFSDINGVAVSARLRTDLMSLGCDDEASNDNNRGCILQLNLVVDNGKLIASWDYSTNLHKRETIELVADLFQAQLEKLISLKKSHSPISHQTIESVD